MKFRSGDVVKCRADKNLRLVLACDEEDGRAAICGWYDGDTDCSMWEIHTAATDDERLSMLRTVAESKDDNGGPSRRALIARRQLEQEEAP